MVTMNVLYTSTEGNTKSFVEKLKTVAESNGNVLLTKNIGDETEYEIETAPYIAVVPTYLTGGTGTGPDVTEIFTNALGDYIAYENNRQFLKGIVGGGNRNFNVQFDLTGRRYAEKFDVPLLFEFELRGSIFDAEKVYNLMKPLFGGES
ncbi:class Ib ribonucleoside-diphosphate reductase assembly flavoprotein NrdI [Leuconostoc palmae]|uniref:class Ib ribonucleoside-diphosphate reductase assembly flavoprotein NrdI n=1 Tax=Leuconostoc palmae TaxID=501487 RepID=UPI001C7DC69E|nr:class Ib ribonucleoside-diphosphate reductase assembly flavoprotein NrdI [Leuconostoc palmae]